MRDAWRTIRGVVRSLRIYYGDGERRAAMDRLYGRFVARGDLVFDIGAHRPITFEELEDLEGLNFDLIVTLSPEAHHGALELTRTLAVEVEYWPTSDPTAIEGSREQRLDAYRAVREQLMQRIRARFAGPVSGNE